MALGMAEIENANQNCCLSFASFCAIPRSESCVPPSFGILDQNPCRYPSSPDSRGRTIGPFQNFAAVEKSNKLNFLRT